METHLRTRTTHYKGNSIVYRAGGKGDRAVLVFIHGAGGDSRLFHFQMSELSRDRRVIVPDLPGHGKSRCDYLPTLEDYAGSIERICEAEDVDEIIPAGHSMGGAVALELFRRGIVSLRAFIFISTGATLPVSPEVLDLVVKNFSLFTEFIIRFTYGKSAPPGMKEMSRRELAAMGAQVMENDFRICAGADGRDLLERIAVPTLVIANEGDRMVPPEVVGELQRGIAGSDLIVHPGDSHVPHLMSPDLVNADIKTFLSRIP